MSLLKMFFIFVKIGAILLGGGYVILPILQYEFTEKREILSKEELVDYFAISQSLPGIIAANMSMFIGYKLKGKIGALTAMTGIIFIPFWIIVLLASVIGNLIGNTYLQCTLWGIGVAVIALILLTAREVWQNSLRNSIFYIIFILSLVSLVVFKLSPISVIILYSCFGVFLQLIKRSKK